MDAATDPDAWEVALDEVAQHFASKGAALLTVEGRGPLVLPTKGMAELAARYVDDGWHQRDFRYAGIPVLKQRGIMVDQDIVNPDDMCRMEYYADFLQPMGFGWFAGLKVETGDDLWCLTFQRGIAQGAYQKEEQQALLQLGRVVSRAAALARRLEFVKLDGAIEMADALTGPIMFIDRFGGVVRLNKQAEEMVGKKFLIRQGLVSFVNASSEALQRHINAVVWPELSPVASAHLPVTVPQPDGRPLVFQAVRLRGNSRGIFAPAHAILLVTDLNDKSVAAIEYLQNIFQLTAAEARLAHALLRHFSLVQAAAHLNSTHETVRSQLKSIFAKTRTRTQAELVDLLGKIHKL